MFTPLSSEPDAGEIGGGGGGGGLSAAARQQYVAMHASSMDQEEDLTEKTPTHHTGNTRPASTNGLELSSLRSASRGAGSGRMRSSSGSSAGGDDDGRELGLANSLISAEHPSEAISYSHSGGDGHSAAASAAASPAAPVGGTFSNLSFEVLSLRLRNLMLEDASETAEEELEMTDYDNPEDHILERKLDEDGSSSAGGSGVAGRGCASLCSRAMGFCGLHSRAWRKLRLTTLRMLITILIGVCIGLTGFAVSRTVSAMIKANLHILGDLMSKDRPAAAFFAILVLSCIYTGVAALFVTFGSWQTRGSGVGRLNAYLSGMSSSKFLALKTLFVKIFGLILTVSAGIKQGMEGPFIHIGAMIGLHVSRFVIWVLNLLFSRWGVAKYTQIISGVVDERMFISSGAAAGFSVAFNAPIAGVLYVQDGAFAYWQGEYTIRTFLCTMTAVTTINMCWKEGDVLPSRGLIDVGNFLPTTITLQEFWGFIVLGVIGGLMGIMFTKLNIAVEKFRSVHVAKLRLHNVLDVLACTVLTVLLSFILPFMLGCHSRYDDWCTLNPDRCMQFHCGPQRYSDLATFFFTLPEETIRILFDRTPSPEAQIPYQTLIVFCIFYTLMACVSYGMAVPGGLFIPSIVIGASYGRLVGLAVQSVLPTADGTTSVLGINPGVYAVLGSASMLGGITRMTLPISVMMIELTSDSQFLIPVMGVVLLAKVVADFGCGSLYAEHLKLDGLVMVFGDRPPGALKKLLARDVMSARAVRKLAVIDSVDSAWAALRDTRHNAFPVTDSGLATLRSIITQRRRQVAAGSGSRRRSVRSRRTSGSINMEEFKSSSAVAAPSSSSSSAAPEPVSTVGTGVFLGLIQRRHLIYVLTSMPCFANAATARDSEPMTALPYELALSASNAAASRRADSPEDGGLQVVSLGGEAPSPVSPSVSHALMHEGGAGSPSPALLNEEGASASASFVEWIARTSAGVGRDLHAVQTGAETLPQPTTLPLQTAATRPLASSSAPPRTPSPPSDASVPVLPSRALSPDSDHSSSGGHGHNGHGGHGHVVPAALGHDLSVHPSMLSHFVNLSPFIDQGAYTVSENISARRVWALFRSLGMRHIVVLNHQHQPVGVITRRDLIRFAVAQ